MYASFSFAGLVGDFGLVEALIDVRLRQGVCGAFFRLPFSVNLLLWLGAMIQRDGNLVLRVRLAMSENGEFVALVGKPGDGPRLWLRTLLCEPVLRLPLLFVFSVVFPLVWNLASLGSVGSFDYSSFPVEAVWELLKLLAIGISCGVIAWLLHVMTYPFRYPEDGRWGALRRGFWQCGLPEFVLALGGVFLGFWLVVGPGVAA